MMTYQLIKDEQQWTLSEENCQGFFNDETEPLADFDYNAVMSWMQNLESDHFEIEYFEEDCEICPPKPRGKKKLVPYLEGHFYVFSKDRKSVITSIDPNYVIGSFDTMQVLGKVDQSYILSVIVCPVCGSYQISLEQVEM